MMAVNSGGKCEELYIQSHAALKILKAYLWTTLRSAKCFSAKHNVIVNAALFPEGL
jgi:hypothetical protein